MAIILRNMYKRMAKAVKWNKTADILFPLRCPVCDKPVPYFDRQKGICPECMEGFLRIEKARCCLCGRRLAANDGELCEDCRTNGRRHYYTKGIALYEYNDMMRKAVYRFKYEGRREYAEFFGKALARQFGNAVKRAGVEGIIPVPLHPKRENERGYNQAGLLARIFGEETQIPVYEKYVVRIRNTPPMKALEGAKRQNNLKKAFKIGQNDVKLNITIIVDDIYTTGSTIDAMAKVLLEAGISQVYFMTLAIGKDF